MIGAVLLFCGLAGQAAASPKAGFEAVVEAGYRVDDLDWNIAGFNSSSPGEVRSEQQVNVLSELTWSDVQIAQVGASFLTASNGLILKGGLYFGDIFGGENRDSDYDFNNRQGEFSRSDNRVFGDVLDANISLGFRYQFGQAGRPKLYVMPTIGTALHIQSLGMTDGYQAFYVPDVNTGVPDPALAGPITNLDTTYDTRWASSWLGVDLWRDMTPSLTLLFSLELHVGDYSAEANWNLRDDFAHPVSFRHWADAQGVKVAAKGRYRLSGKKFLSLALSHQNWRTDPGIDKVYFANGAVVDTRLNEVNWRSSAVNIGLGWEL